MRLQGNLNELPSGATIPAGQLHKPRSCVVIPNRTTDPEGFIDTRQSCPGCDAPTYVSLAALREMARVSGILVDAKEVEELKAEFAETEQALYDLTAELKAEVEHLRKLADARALLDEEVAV